LFLSCHVSLAVPPETSFAGGNPIHIRRLAARRRGAVFGNDGELFAGKLIFVQANSRAISELTSRSAAGRIVFTSQAGGLAAQNHSGFSP
jgi:hypothetical protein